MSESHAKSKSIRIDNLTTINTVVDSQSKKLSEYVKTTVNLGGNS
jgi:hypothetical protein